jgi:2Fe-2S iron-sulfur cluster binding domain
VLPWPTRCFIQLDPDLLRIAKRKKTVLKVAIDGVVQEAQPDELLIDLINRTGGSVPHVCYHPQLGPVQTCDTCMVEENGRLVRACATRVADGMTISTKSSKASAAQVEAFDRILSNHLLYCTVCDNSHSPLWRGFRRTWRNPLQRMHACAQPVCLFQAAVPRYPRCRAGTCSWASAAA